MIRDIKAFAESAAKWSPERIQRAKETVRVFDLTLSMPMPELKESGVVE